MSEPGHVDGSVAPVVVGCDGSWPAAQAVLAAATAARRRGTQLKLLVVERPHDTSTTGQRAAVEHARYVGETARLQVHDADPSLETEVILVGDVRDERVRQLADRAGLLVLGPYGAGGQVALSLGSASDALARAFPCPLLLPHARVGESLRPGTRPPTVVAAIGRNDRAHAVVAAAAREAAERHVPLLVLHTLSVHDAAKLTTEQDWVATVLAEVGVPSWLPCRTVVTVADPVAAALDRVEPDDVLVVATRGEGRLAGLVSGSVTRALLDAGHCDVMVVNHVGVREGVVQPTSVTSKSESGTSPNVAVTLPTAECWALLRSTVVGRLGVSVGGRQDIFPVNHVVSRESVLFRTAQGFEFDADGDQSVAFEVDGFDPVTGRAWSVVVKGTARELLERDEIIRALRLPITPVPGDPKPRIIQIDPDPDRGAVTGRRFTAFGGPTTVTSNAPEGWLPTPSAEHAPVLP